MFWADEIAHAAHGPQVVNDSKTPSGTIHVGALRGVIIHDVIVRALTARGLAVRFVFGIDDLDPFDAVALADAEGLTEFLGRPLADVPAPGGSDAASWARHFAEPYLDTFERLGVRPEFYWASEQYRAGVFDAFIAEALDRAAEVRRVYREVGNVRHPDDWHPLQVICERCGRIGTTYVDGWDGRTVSYRCLPDLVEWATGCGEVGRVSPFGGRAKLPWNLHWVAKWRHFGVTIEGAGKDLATRGGSRDRADALAREVFGFEPPRNVPYEFFTLRGRKMRSSEGTGAAAHLVADLLPPQLVRFLMLRHRPQSAIDFDPAGETVPRLFDEFDSYLAEAAAGPPKAGDPEAAQRRRVVEMSLLPGERPSTDFLPPFVQVVTYAQMPGASPHSVAEQIARHRGAPLAPDERDEVERRLETARRWLAESWAPDRLRFTVRTDALPEAAAELTQPQREYLARLQDRLESVATWEGEPLQAEIFGEARQAGLRPGQAFAAIYLAFCGKPSGPRAGSLLASLERGFVIERFAEAAGSRGPSAGAAAR